MGLAGCGFADSSGVLCIDPFNSKNRIDFLRIPLYQRRRQTICLDIATFLRNVKRYIGEEGNRKSKTASSVFFFNRKANFQGRVS